MTVAMTELIEAGLLTGGDAPNWSDKDREWMHALESVDHQSVDLSEAAADLVLSTSGLYR
jgi:hypothetical protein